MLFRANECPVDLPIDKIVLYNTKGAAERHYRLRKPSKRI